ncbi:MAG: superoxide dismutase [Bacteroidales bacterium]|jgi:Fe-Mn family superoxide dismutase|nr:superoxide dismutase [Bacteroidales bacterium]
MSFVLKPLPYPMDALMPYIDARTVEFHYTKHHQGYVNKLNELIKESNFEDKSLEQIIKESTGPIFNNAAQVWNHSFYWDSLAPAAKKEPGGKIKQLIDNEFNGFEAFKEKFSNMAVTLFGSGWCWLVQQADGKLQIIQTNNAETPLTTDMNPLLTCDVWEHAYYLDYQNRRPDYVKAFWNVVNWEAVESRLK